MICTTRRLALHILVVVCVCSISATVVSCPRPKWIILSLSGISILIHLRANNGKADLTLTPFLTLLNIEAIFLKREEEEEEEEEGIKRRRMRGRRDLLSCMHRHPGRSGWRKEEEGVEEWVEDQEGL